MVRYILKNSIGVIAVKPVSLWGISLLYALITSIICVLGVNVPIISIPVTLTLSAAMSAIYLDGYAKRNVETKQLFAAFKRDCVLRIAGGMCWYRLWALIWSVVPVAGIVKMYSYRFTPYILMTRPEISAQDALAISKLETYGYRKAMFLTDLVIALPLIILALLFLALTQLSGVGIVFLVLEILLIMAVCLFLPLFTGVVSAAFYKEVKNGTFTAAANKSAGFAKNTRGFSAASAPSAAATAWSCKACGTENAAGTLYCRACGEKCE